MHGAMMVRGDAFRRIGHLDVEEVLPKPAAISPEFAYRNRIRLSYEPGRGIGLVRRGSNQVIPVDACHLMPEAWNGVALPWLRTLPTADKASFRLDTAGGMIALLAGRPSLRGRIAKRMSVLEKKEPPFPGALGVLFNGRSAWGRRQLAVDLAMPGDLVITFGKGHEQSMCFGTEETPWSEHSVLRAALRRRLGRGHADRWTAEEVE